MSGSIIHYPADMAVMEPTNPSTNDYLTRSINPEVGSATSSSAISSLNISIKAWMEGDKGKKRLNILKLESFSSLEDGWNGPASLKPTQEIINRTKALIELLRIQPEIFPTGRNSIQLEYERGNSYFEIEIFKDKIICFYSGPDGTELEWTLKGSDSDVISAVVDRIYAA